MARPVEFDQATVLTNAMEHFWRYGFEASSIQKLLDCTGINRGTLYNSFGNKEALFKACVAHYNQLLAAQLDQSLNNPELGPWQAIDRWLQLTVLDSSNRQRAMGCLLVNSLCSSINHDPSLRRVVRAALTQIRKPLLARLQQTHQQGKLKKGVSPEAAADILINMLHGIRVNSRQGKNARQLQDLIKFTVNALKR